MNLWENLTEIKSKQDQITEITKKYKNSIVGLQIKDKIHYCMFNRFYPQKGFHFLDKYQNDIYLDYTTKFNLIIPKIKKGYYEDQSKQVFYLSKTANRQWIRGLCEENIHIQNIFNTLSNNFIATPNFIYVLIQILSTDNDTPKQITTELLKQLKNYPYIIKLTSDFIITLHTKKETGYSLFFHNILVGTITEKNKTLYLEIENPHFYQEIIDSISTWGDSLTLI